jgi:hypothetical protein
MGLPLNEPRRNGGISDVTPSWPGNSSFAASGYVCPLDDPAWAWITGVAVPPGDVAADHAALFAVGRVVGFR